MEELKIGDKVIVNDEGLLMLYNAMKKIDSKYKPNNQGWVEDIYNDSKTILVKFPR